MVAWPDLWRQLSEMKVWTIAHLGVWSPASRPRSTSLMVGAGSTAAARPAVVTWWSRRVICHSGGGGGSSNGDGLWPGCECARATEHLEMRAFAAGLCSSRGPRIRRRRMLIGLPSSNRTAWARWRLTRDGDSWWRHGRRHENGYLYKSQL